MGDKLGYRVAIDSAPAPPEGEDNVPMFVKAHGACSRTWLSSSGMSDEGIPAVFVVDGRGRLAWIGNDTVELKRALEQVVDGRWDLESYSAAYATEAGILQRGRTLERECFEARQREDWPRAVGHAWELMTVDDRYRRFAGLVFRLTWRQLGDHAGAITFADSQVGHNPSADAFVEMAEAIAADARATAPELAAAEAYARHTNTMEQGKSPAPFATLAKLASRRGDRDGALAMQREAVARTTDPEERAEAEKRLVEYGQ
jgi:hypothetical protein